MVPADLRVFRRTHQGRFPPPPLSIARGLFPARRLLPPASASCYFSPTAVSVVACIFAANCIHEAQSEKACCDGHYSFYLLFPSHYEVERRHVCSTPQQPRSGFPWGPPAFPSCVVFAGSLRMSTKRSDSELKKQKSTRVQCAN